MAFAFAGQYGPEPVIDRYGNAVYSATFRVLTTAGAEATVYTDRTKAATVSQPLDVDGEANATFYATPGRYTVELTAGGSVTSFPVGVVPDAEDVEPAPDVAAQFAETVKAIDAAQHPSLQAAADAAAAAGRPLYIPSGVWTLTAPVELPDDMLVFGAGEQTVIDVSAYGTNQGAFHITGTMHELRALSADATEGSRTVTLGTEADATYLAGFDWLKIHSERSTGISGIKQGEWVQIESQSTNTLTLRDPLTDTYRTVDTAQITAFTMRRNVTIRDLTVRGGTDPAVMHGGIKTQFAHNIRVTNCRFYRTHYTGCMMWNAVAWQVTDCIFDEILAAGTGYGVAAGWASQDGVVANCIFRRMRHGFTTTGGSATGTYGRSARISVIGSKAYHCTSSGFDTHQGAIDVVFDGCTVIAGVGGIGILLRCNSATVTNCTIRNIKGAAVNYGVQVVSNDEAPGQIVVTNNNITGPPGETFHAIRVESALDYPNWDGVVISGNRISQSWMGIDIRNDQGHVMMPITVVSNTMAKIGNYGIYVDATPAVAITGNAIRMAPGGTRGILVLNSADVVIAGNVLRGDASTGRGIHVSGSAGHVISGNRAQTFEYGVYLFGDATVLMGNHLRNNTTPLADNGTNTISNTTNSGGAYNAV